MPKVHNEQTIKNFTKDSIRIIDFSFASSSAQPCY